MKRIMLGVPMLLWVVMLHAQQIFSRYNYYLPTQQATVVCVLPDSADNYNLTLFKEEKVLTTTSVVKDQRLTAVTDLPVGNTTLQYLPSGHILFLFLK
jgi:hypothetical protein